MTIEGNEPSDRVARLLAANQWALRRVLVPVDGSRLAESVLPPIEWFAMTTGATISLLHVLEHEPPTEVHGEPHLRDAAAAAAYLDGLAERLAANGVQVEHHVHDNPQHDVPASIIDHAAELGIDLIALAAHGRGGVRGFLFGRIAQQVVRRGTIPVFLMQPPATQLPQAGYQCQQIIVSLNGRSDAEIALPVVRSLASGVGAAVSLVYAVPTVQTVDSQQAATAVLVPGTTRAILDLEEGAAATYLAMIAGAMTDHGMRVSAAVVRGDPALEVAEYAESTGADLLAIATHGRGGFGGLLTGSVGTKIVSRFKRPLLLVPISD